MRLEDGREVSISDAGDVILETEVPFAIEIREDFDLAEGWPDLSSSEDLEARITQVRLAHLLAGTDHRAPVMLPVWRRFVEPLAQGGGVGWSDPQQFAGRTPTLLSADQLTRWQEWIDRLSTVPVRRLGPAPTRLLRASAERRDGADSLIDAVIAWEALFGAETEATLRVSGALAKLLHAAGDERRSLRRRAAEIYRLRSKVVHGVDVDPREIAEAGLEATDLGIRALRVIVSDRPHLIELASGERSTQILME